MQETVYIKIKSSNLIKLLYGYQFSKRGHFEVSTYTFRVWGHGIYEISESILNIAKRLDFALVELTVATLSTFLKETLLCVTKKCMKKHEW